jgi:hypothetical protein
MDTENKKDNTGNYALALVIMLVLGVIIIVVKLILGM